MVSEIKKITCKRRLYGWARNLKDPLALYKAVCLLFDYCRNAKEFSLPLAVAWELTYRCDCFCPFCATHKLADAKGEPSRKDALRIAESIGRAGVRFVTLSGGEPLLSENLITVLNALRKYKLKVSISTNGSRLEDFASTLAELGVDSITISIDSVDPEKLDAMKGQRGLYKKIEKGISAIKAHPKGNKIILRVRCLIVPQNYQEIVELAKKWHNVVDEVCFQPAMHIDSGHVHQILDDSYRFRADMRESFEAQLKELFSLYPEYDVPYYRKMVDFLFEPEAIKNSFYCLVPAIGFRVMATGDVVLCSDSNKVVGNLIHQEVRDVWNHLAFRELRTKSRHRQRDCLCWVQQTKINFMVPKWLLSLVK